MSGRISGVSTQLLNEEPRAIYTHCYGHALNLACQDTVRSVKVVKDALDTLSKLLKYSSKRNAAFKKIKDDIAPSEPGFRTLCPTRWTVKADSLGSVIKNYSVLQTSLDAFTHMAARDMEMSARVNGIASQLDKFYFLFGVFLGEKVLRLADNLSCTLQRKELSAAEGNSAALLTCDALSALRNNHEFEQFWSTVLDKASAVGIEEPVLPRRRRAPARFEIGEGSPHYHSSVKDYYYRPQFFEAIDLIVRCIKDRFNQPGFQVYSKLEKLLLNAANKRSIDSEFDEIIKLYGSDFNPPVLKTQLQILSTKFATPVSFSAVKKFLVDLGEAQSVLSEVVKLVSLILVMPATNATSERSFSALKRVKTYLRTSMKQQRLCCCTSTKN